ncbi:putative transposase [Pseudomonas chlororaphis subsp. aurantiaca]|nr:putative transposase [Pseudomonas chlororaphis subsp. aurantiaca]
MNSRHRNSDTDWLRTWAYSKGEEVDEGGSKAAILGFATALGRGRARYFSGPAQALEKSGFSPGIRGLAAVSAGALALCGRLLCAVDGLCFGLPGISLTNHYRQARRG